MESQNQLNVTDPSGNKSPGPASLQDKPESSSSTAHNFPFKLHQILSTPEFNDIICWLPHGRAWRIQQQDRLESEVLPMFFQHNKYSSFYRQVYGWGFHRILSGPDFNSFYHELFLRDSPDLSLKMKRPSKKELTERRHATPDSPPNFYLMPPISESETDSSVDNTSLPAMIMDEYWDNLMKRLSGFSSLQEKGLYLQTKLDQLEAERLGVLHRLQLLRNLQREHQLVPHPMNRGDMRIPFDTSGRQLPLQRGMLRSQQQVRDSLDPWIQRAAQEIYLERQMQFGHEESERSGEKWKCR
ncbi:unnamed protein product [Cylindrotheca closterium]|uniref:HSF-type DNA-binding domain-containing protein n=1 Tax=Cylindrotheca closterium TaxID=2856 RepID=A0AAD2GDF5_9STRA|nr:unnamed protein product [Cylindrotheca closterium]